MDRMDTVGSKSTNKVTQALFDNNNKEGLITSLRIAFGDLIPKDIANKGYGMYCFGTWSVPTLKPLDKDVTPEELANYLCTP